MGKAAFVLALMMLTLAVPLAGAEPVCQDGTQLVTPALFNACADSEAGTVQYSNRDFVVLAKNEALLTLGSNPSDADLYLKTTNFAFVIMATEVFVEDERVATCGFIWVPSIIRVDNSACLGSNNLPPVETQWIVPLVTDLVDDVRSICRSPPRCFITP